MDENKNNTQRIVSRRRCLEEHTDIVITIFIRTERSSCAFRYEWYIFIYIQIAEYKETNYYK